ncbi:MAG: hypothetical protein OEY70_14165 [Acidimicrobiia bacterium]|nr:hypothetical protein [Acidimicrobiia bacterium]
MEHIDNHRLDERGAGLAEYAILLLFVLLASVTILTTLGGTIAGFFTSAVGMFA